MTLNEQISILTNVAAQVEAWPKDRINALENGAWTTEVPSIDIRVTLLGSFIEHGACVRHISITCYGPDTLGTDLFVHENGTVRSVNRVYRLVDGCPIDIPQ